MSTTSELPLDEHEAQWAQRAANLARDHVRPGAIARDQGGAFPEDLTRLLATHQMMGVNVSTSLGGAEAGVVPYSLAITEIARADASVGVTVSVNNMVCEILEKFATDAVRSRYVGLMTGGQATSGSFCLSEPGSGSDAGAMITRARDIKSGWIIEGNKTWITSGAHASVLLVWAQTEMPDGSTRPSAFVVDPSWPGVSTSEPERKMGQHASHTVTVSLDGVEVPRDHLLGQLGKGFTIAMVALDGGRIGVASLAVGLANEAIAIARRHATEHDTLSDPHTMDTLASMQARCMAAHLLTIRAARAKQSGQGRFTREASMAKLYATEAACTIADDALRLIGPGALGDEAWAIERIVRDARVTRIYEGTSEIQRIVLARDILHRFS